MEYQAKFVAGMHQFTPNFTKVNLHFAYAPKTTAAAIEKLPNIQHTYFTFGVPNCIPSAKELKNSYDEWRKNNNLEIGKDGCVIVMLPGDAPDPSTNSMKIFTQQSAAALCDLIAKLAGTHKKTIILHNGPRTGKHDPETHEVVCTHEYKGVIPKDPQDPISLYIVDELKKREYDVKFFNFGFLVDEKTGEKRAVSAFNPLVYFASASAAPCNVVISGESVSNLSLLPHFIKRDKLFVFEPDSMNSSHEAVLEEALQRGYVRALDQYKVTQHTKQSDAPLQSDAEAVVEAFLKSLTPLNQA